MGLAFFRFGLKRREPGMRQGFVRGDLFALEPDLGFAEHRQRKVRERREIA
jgi:hypothetical protein